MSEFTCCQLAASGASEQIRLRERIPRGSCALYAKEGNKGRIDWDRRRKGHTSTVKQLVRVFP
jgi:hypothetical protein